MIKEEKAEEQEQVLDEKSTAENKSEAEGNGKKTDSKKKASRKSKDSGKEVKEKELALAEAKDKFIRLYSEFENYRRRTSKEKIELITTANSELIFDMLPVIDDFERAFQPLEGNGDSSESALKGFKLIYNKLASLLQQKGLKLMEIEKGDEFDSDFHDAIAKIPNDDKKLSGKIVDVTEKGYFLGERVIRHAKVVIGS